jgi:hypothetical protein
MNTNKFQYDDLMKDAVQPVELTNKIKTLQEKLPVILDDFKKYYVFFNKNPTYNEYQTIYENLKANLNSISNELLIIANDVEKNSKNIGDALLEINKLIENEKKQNFKFKTIETGLDNVYNGSKIMINEYKYLYNENYIKNILIFLGIGVAITTLIKVFSNTNNLPLVNK